MKLHENHIFEAKFWGTVKAEFYTRKSYLRWLGENGKPYLIVSDEAPGTKFCRKHQENIYKLIEYVKDGRSKEDIKKNLEELKEAVDVD